MTILCHIVGMNEGIKDDFFKLIAPILDYVVVKDIDVISSKIVNDRGMSKLYKKYAYYFDKHQENKKNKNFASKYKDVEKKMNTYWKTKMSYNIEKFCDQNKGKMVILVGQNCHWKNKRTHVKIDTNNKFFVKINLKNNARQIVEQNLDNHRKEIISGSFPLEFLDIDFLIKKREALQTTYSRKGYVLKSIKNIANLVLMNVQRQGEFDKIDKLYVGLPTKLNGKIHPFYKGQVVAYSEEWLAIVSIPNYEKKRDDGFKKGYINRSPFVKELERGAFDRFHMGGYLYEVDKNNFSYHEKGSAMKFVTNKSIKFKKRIYIPILMERLNEMQISFIMKK